MKLNVYHQSENFISNSEDSSFDRLIEESNRLERKATFLIDKTEHTLRKLQLMSGYLSGLEAKVALLMADIERTSQQLKLIDTLLSHLEAQIILEKAPT